MDGILRWEDPPADGRGRPSVAHEYIAAKLRANPGRWARLLDLTGTGYVADIQTGRLRAYRPSGSFEAVSRAGGHVYARYVGESS